MSIPMDVVSLLGGRQSFEEAREAADRIARKRNEARYVVLECGVFYVASDGDLQTFFAGTAYESILYETE